MHQPKLLSELGLDPSSTKDRAKAGRYLHKRRRSESQQQMREELDRPGPDKSVVAQSTMPNTERAEPGVWVSSPVSSQQ